MALVHQVKHWEDLKYLCFVKYTERVFRCSAEEISVEYARRKLPTTSLWNFLFSLLTKIQRGDKDSYFNVRRYMYHKDGIGNVYKAIAKGIKDYSESDIRKDYILGLFVPFQILIVASTALNNGSKRGEQLISLVIKRMQSIIDDHNLLSQLSRI